MARSSDVCRDRVGYVTISARCRSRTHYLLGVNETLYPDELIGHIKVTPLRIELRLLD